MTDLTTTSNINESCNEKELKDEVLNAFEELDYMENHPEEYKSFQSVEELMEDLNSED